LDEQARNGGNENEKQRNTSAGGNDMSRISIEGSDEFKERTTEALNLLEEKDPVNFRRLNRHIKKIVESQNGGFVDIQERVFYESLHRLDDNAAMYAACMAHETAHLVLTDRFGLDWYDEDRIPISWIKHERVAYGTELRSLKRIDPENPRVEKLKAMISDPIAIPGRILRDLENTLKADPNCPAETRIQILEDIQRKIAHYNFSKYGPAGLGYT